MRTKQRARGFHPWRDGYPSGGKQLPIRFKPARPEASDEEQSDSSSDRGLGDRSTAPDDHPRTNLDGAAKAEEEMDAPGSLDGDSLAVPFLHFGNAEECDIRAPRGLFSAAIDRLVDNRATRVPSSELRFRSDEQERGGDGKRPAVEVESTDRPVKRARTSSESVDEGPTAQRDAAAASTEDDQAWIFDYAAMATGRPQDRHEIDQQASTVGTKGEPQNETARLTSEADGGEAQHGGESPSRSRSPGPMPATTSRDDRHENRGARGSSVSVYNTPQASSSDDEPLTPVPSDFEIRSEPSSPTRSHSDDSYDSDASARQVLDHWMQDKPVSLQQLRAGGYL